MEKAAWLRSPRKSDGILTGLLGQQAQFAASAQLVYFKKYFCPAVGGAFLYERIQITLLVLPHNAEHSFT
jgi:hypothetical protein